MGEGSQSEGWQVEKCSWGCSGCGGCGGCGVPHSQVVLAGQQLKTSPLVERDLVACCSLRRGLPRSGCPADGMSHRFAFRRKSFPAERTCLHWFLPTFL